METSPTAIETIDAYIAQFPADIQQLLQNIRALIHETAPEASEAIKYAMPTFVLRGGNLVHFAAFKAHIGFYPVPTGIEAFKEEFSVYKTAKGSVQFPLNQPMPYELIRKVVAYRVEETLQKLAAKATKKTKAA